jgi:hypothetical protein
MAITSRSKLNHPDLGTAGGSGLWNSIDNIYEELGDADNSRYAEFSSVGDSTVSEIDHNFGSTIDQLMITIYSGTGTTKTQIIDPIDSGWAFAEKTGSENLVLEVTTPGSGGPHTFTVIVVDGAQVEKELVQMVATAPGNPAASNILAKYYDQTGRGLAKDSSGNVYTQQTLTPTIISSADNASPGRLYKADTTGAGFTITLPATIQDYDVIEIVDLGKSFNTGNLTVARNGNSIDGEASDLVLNTKGQGIKLIGDNANSNWIVVNSVAGDSGESGTNYYQNGSFESDLQGVTVSGGTAGTLSVETTSPLEGIQSCKITQGVGTAADVRFAIDVTDSWVEEGGIVPLVEALVKADAADADGDSQFGVWNSTDSVWLYGPVDITGGGELNIIRASASTALEDGKTYQGRLLRTDSTDTREVLVDRLRLDPINGNAVIPEATDTSLGLTYKTKAGRVAGNSPFVTSSTSFVIVPGMTHTFELEVPGYISFAFCGGAIVSVANNLWYRSVFVDGSPVESSDGNYIGNAADTNIIHNAGYSGITDLLTAGSHTIDFRIKASSGSITVSGGSGISHMFSAWVIY